MRALFEKRKEKKLGVIKGEKVGNSAHFLKCSFFSI
jgi:hypothetical protein